ncbi:MAG: hypothetical protein P9L92_14495 [Candidatus Electryonea clarkiae]|nr:hypothetical protein [Candidatus Electryonea clarkiae]
MESMEISMEEASEIQGLCATCNHLEECKPRLNDGLVIWYCEEFDDHVSSEKSMFSIPAEKKPSTNGRSNYVGLCINCDLANDCVHAKKTGGVWYCEQYE